MASDRDLPVMRQHIFHISYYDSLLRTRKALLERDGYDVSSVLGNEQAKNIAPELLPQMDAVLLGFSGDYSQRAAILHWLKEHYPAVPVVALQANRAERFPEADYATPADDPEVWLATVARCLHRA